MTTRRTFMAAAATAPAVLSGAVSYTWPEIDRMLARGDVKGKLTRNDLPTPALLLDLDAFESNVTKMAGYLKERKLGFRPHGKTHKCPEIARRLVRAGAVGACAAKISEAEVFARHGISGLLVTTAVVGRHKIERAIALARRQPDTMYVVDNTQNAQEINDAAGAAKIKVRLAIDLRVSTRTGIQPGDSAAALAEVLTRLPNVKFAGLQSYAGHASHVTGFEKRKAVSLEAMGRAVETRRLIERKGIACDWLSGGSTGTYNIDSHIDGITELQPGSFMFMDVDYNRIGGADGAFYSDFRNALTVATTVVSKPDDKTAVVDGGFKAFSTDKPFPPEPKEKQPLTYSFGGDEHGMLALAAGARPYQVGDRIEFIIPHCDPSVNLYDRMFCLRGDGVEAVWPISARGMSQ